MSTPRQYISNVKDILDGWRLYRCDNGTYDAKHEASEHDGYDYHNLGNGRTELSAWVCLRELLETRELDELEDLDKHCPTCRCNEHS
jgi:hypothetical protein